VVDKIDTKMSTPTINNQLIELMLPNGILEYFEVTGFDEVENGLIIHLEEQNKLPDGYNASDYETKDFTEGKFIEDFPLRDKGVKLFVVCRRWRHKTTGKTITRKWDGFMDGGLVTKEFADFLKELD
jgi:hypothetical protein